MESIRINEDTWRIEDGGVRFFLLCGSERAMVIDTGMTGDGVRNAIEGLTDLPLILINTHADIDHVGGNREFDIVYMHAAELYNYKGDITPVWDGEIIDLGNRQIKIIHTPGHTPGSIALFDMKYRALFSGDPIQDGSIFLFGEQRNLRAYRHSLKRINDMKSDIDAIYPSHGSIPVNTDIIDKLIDGTDSVMRGEVIPQKGEFFGKTINVCDIGVAKLLIDCN